MWRLADRQLDTFLSAGRCEYIGQYAAPFAMLVIADLLGVPEEDHPNVRGRAAPRPSTGAVGSTEQADSAHTPLQYLYEQFTEYVEDRRRAPRDDVLTGLATATFPDGSMPEVIDVGPHRLEPLRRRPGDDGAAAELGAEAPRRGAGAPGHAPQAERDRIPNFIEEALRMESPVKGDFRMSRVPDHGGGRGHPGRHHRDAAQRGGQP